jgi:hypothetical protein
MIIVRVGDRERRLRLQKLMRVGGQRVTVLAPKNGRIDTKVGIEVEAEADED